jgi:hypothetical protein
MLTEIVGHVHQAKHTIEYCPPYLEPVPNHQKRNIMMVTKDTKPLQFYSLSINPG